MKKINLLIIFIITMVFMVRIDALTIQSPGKRLEFDGTNISNPGNCDNEKYPCFRHKTSDLGDAICTSDNDNPPKVGATCTVSSWPASVKNAGYGVARIIQIVTGTESGSKILTDAQYYWAEVLIKYYIGEYTPKETSYTQINIINKGITLATSEGKNWTWNAIIDEAKSYANSIITPALNVSSNNLTFTLSNDGYYYSNKITISSDIELTPVLSNNKFSYDKTGNDYTFKIKEDDIKAGTTESLKVTFTRNGATYYKAERYNCGATVQEITLSTVQKEEKPSITKELNGFITRETTELIIKKVDSKGNYLAGATIKVENADKSYSETFETKNTEIKITDIPYGEYTITEVSAPSKYVKNDEVKKASLSKDKLSETVEIVNNLVKIEITKINSEDNKPLKGAELHIEDKDGKVIEKWTTDGTSHIVEGLEDGTYYLVEDKAPEGFELNSKKTEFKVDGTKDFIKVELSNKLTTVEISKVSAVNNKELKGATLQILDKDKKEISCTVRKGSKDSEVIDKCTWVSGDTSKIILGLKPGKYYLVETIAPKGYVLNKNAVEFEVKEDGTANKVVMKNELEVKVPDTLSSKSALLLAIAMFDIALGIGIITYVKKNRTQE